MSADLPKSDVHGLVQKFQAMGLRKALGEDISAELPQLVDLAVQTVKAQAPNNWQHELSLVRGKLKMQLHGLEAPHPSMPNKLTEPANQAQRAFFAEAITLLDPLCSA